MVVDRGIMPVGPDFQHIGDTWGIALMLHVNTPKVLTFGGITDQICTQSDPKIRAVEIRLTENIGLLL